MPVEVSLSGEAQASGAPDRIQQVLVNLLDNALKYGGAADRGRSGRRRRRASGSCPTPAPGIPFAEQRLIFERFYRSGPALTRAPGGTGLGLYISRELVGRMDGASQFARCPARGRPSSSSCRERRAG